jgi:hypothetical protein
MDHISRSELDVIIQARLVSEPEFRTRLIADPRGTLTEIVGSSLPDAIKVTVHEESVRDIHLVLTPGAEDLSERDLELVSGGIHWGGTPDTCGSCTL